MADKEAKPKRRRLMTMNHDDTDEQSQNDEKEKDLAAGTLNDDCWLKIINLLCIEDLCNVVQVNRQLKKISLVSFSKRFESVYFPYGLGGFSCNVELRLRQVICNFGHLIKSMILRDRGNIFDIQIEAVSKYCAGTLEDLNLFGINSPFDGDLVKPLFASLKVLRIPWKYFDGMIKECADLKVLTIMLDDSRATGYGYEQNIPNLEELSVVDFKGRNFFNYETVKTLLQLNPNIKKLTLCGSPSYTKTLCLIAAKMEQLEELKLRYKRRDNYDNISELGNLKSLKVLELQQFTKECVLAAIIESMQHISLEHLKLIGCTSNLKFMESILKLKTLKSLALTEISSPIGGFHIKIGEQLPLLEEFTLKFKDNTKDAYMEELNFRCNLIGF